MGIPQLPWTELGIFWISVVLALITVTATVINYLFFRSQIDPEVIVYVTPDERRPSAILLIIENIGHGLAKDVSFSFSKQIPQKAFGFEDAPIPKSMDDGPFITGIPALGPGSKRVITWGQYGGLFKGIGNDVINVSITYKSDRIIPFWKRIHKTICPIDIKSFEGTDASDKNWDKKTADQLEVIAKLLKQAVSGNRSLKIEIIENHTILKKSNNANKADVKKSGGLS